MSNVKKYFDLHFEVGQTGTGYFYARTVLGVKGSIEYREEGGTPAVAIHALARTLEMGNLWGTIAQNPSMCQYPFAGPQIPLAVTIDPNAPKKRPSDLSSVAYPGCQTQCTSYDHFGAGKCKSMCAQRSGV